MNQYLIKYWAWGQRIKVYGEFVIAGKSREDAVHACMMRWPDMNITYAEQIVEC